MSDNSIDKRAIGRRTALGGAAGLGLLGPSMAFGQAGPWAQAPKGKVLTTQRPEQGVLSGARLVLGDTGLHFSDIDVFIHGTTLATNAIIERRGARTALIATDGFRDTLDIATESRYDQYDLTIEKPQPLVPRSLRFTVPERVDVHGNVRLTLDEAAVAAQVARLKDNGIEAVAICFMHSYVNPEHEQRAGEILKKAMPELSITLSCEVCPEIREYERTSTAVANAYVQPLMDGYLARMDEALRVEQFRGAVYLVTSGGGLTSIDTARKFPVRLIESGPAGGAIFASQIAARGGEKKVLSFDMGGTTAKICLIENYEPNSARVYEVDDRIQFKQADAISYLAALPRGTKAVYFDPPWGGPGYLDRKAFRFHHFAYADNYRFQIAEYIRASFADHGQGHDAQEESSGKTFVYSLLLIFAAEALFAGLNA